MVAAPTPMATKPISASPSEAKLAIEIANLRVRYGARVAIDGVGFGVPARRITALIGSSASGKSTLLRCLNRLNDEVANCRVEGSVRIGGVDVYARNVEVHELRRRVGMVFQRPNPFPLSVYDNVAYGPRLYGTRGARELDAVVEASLRAATLWDEVASRLDESAAGKAALATAGLFGGLLLGAGWAFLQKATELDAVWIVVKCAAVGSILGIAAALSAATGGRRSLTTTRGLAWLIAATAIVLAFWKSIP